jgi:hypothetical protein
MVAVVGCSVWVGKGSRLQRRWYYRSDVGGSVAIVVVGDYVWRMQLRTGRSMELKKAFQVTRPVAFWGLGSRRDTECQQSTDDGRIRWVGLACSLRRDGEHDRGFRRVVEAVMQLVRKGRRVAGDDTALLSHSVASEVQWE